MEKSSVVITKAVLHSLGEQVHREWLSYPRPEPVSILWYRALHHYLISQGLEPQFDLEERYK